jgi:hypothetical protein
MNPRGYTGAAEAYLALGQEGKAKDVLEKGLAVLPDDAEIKEMLDELLNVLPTSPPEGTSEPTPSTTAPNPAFDPQTAFIIDDIELGVTDLSAAKAKYSGRSDYMSNLMNDDTDDTVYSMPYMDDDDPDNDMTFGYLFVQPVGGNTITHMYISDKGFVYMGKYRAGDGTTDFAEGMNEFNVGNQSVSVIVLNGVIQGFNFNMVNNEDEAVESVKTATRDESITVSVPNSDGLTLTLIGYEDEYSMMAATEYSTFDVYYFYLRETGTFSFNQDVWLGHGNDPEVFLKAGERLSFSDADGRGEKITSGYGYTNSTKTVIIRIETASEYMLAKTADYLIWHPLSDMQ